MLGNARLSPINAIHIEQNAARFHHVFRNSEPGDSNRLSALERTARFAFLSVLQRTEVALSSKTLSNITLVEVLVRGGECRLRITGDEIRRSYTARLCGRLLIGIGNDLPGVTQKWKEVYQEVVDRGVPIAVRLQCRRGVREINFSSGEVVCLPFGEEGIGVNYLLTVGVLRREALA